MKGLVVMIKPLGDASSMSRFLYFIGYERIFNQEMSKSFSCRLLEAKIVEFA